MSVSLVDDHADQMVLDRLKVVISVDVTRKPIDSTDDVRFSDIRTIRRLLV